MEHVLGLHSTPMTIRHLHGNSNSQTQKFNSLKFSFKSLVYTDAEQGAKVSLFQQADGKVSLEPESYGITYQARPLGFLACFISNINKLLSLPKEIVPNKYNLIANINSNAKHRLKHH